MNNNELPNANNLRDINLRDFLYLDRARLLSYTAQIHDGLHLSRRLGNSALNGRIDSTLERSREEKTIVQSEGNAAPFNIGFKASHHHETTSSVTSGGDLLVAFEASSFEELKQDQDNLFLLLEKFLIETNRLTDISNGQEAKTPFVQITGWLQIEDRDFILEILANIESLLTVGGVNREQEKQNRANKHAYASIGKVLKAFKLNNCHIHVQNSNTNATSSLNSNYLTITIEQLRSIYLTNPVEVTLIGLIVSKLEEQIVRPKGMFSELDLPSLLQPFTAEAEHTIYPIAIYQTLKW